MVGDKGNVLLIDEWANIASRYAVMVVDRENRPIAQHDFEAVRKVLGVPAAQVAQMARHGVWIVRAPVWDIPGVRVLIEAAGKTLRVDISNGAIGRTGD
jgi:hypothetical protein